jgi:aspartate/methionine/tyrosine aminotransferase
MTVSSPLVRAIGAPPIPAARAWAARYRGQAGPAIDLTQAVPGYPPHPDLLAKLAEAAGTRAGASYGDIFGDEALRAALAGDLSRRYGAAFSAGEVSITAGCNLAFGMAMTAIAEPGAAVMLPAPWYFNHEMALRMQGVGVVPLPCRAEAGFVPDVEEAARLVTPATRAIVLVTPNNPTGAVYSPEVSAAFAKLCRARGLWLVLDETYRDFLPGEAAPHSLFSDPDWGEYLVHLYSFSKAYCVPGHRVGAIACGGALREQLAKVLDTMQICPPRAAQTALTWAVEGLRDWREGNKAIMAGRAAAFARVMAGVNDWQVDALGGYFAYLRLPEGAPDAMVAAEMLAAERGLMGLPGPFFGPGQGRHIRLAFANAEEAAIALVPERLAGGLGGALESGD